MHALAHTREVELHLLKKTFEGIVPRLRMIQRFELANGAVHFRAVLPNLEPLDA